VVAYATVLNLSISEWRGRTQGNWLTSLSLYLSGRRQQGGKPEKKVKTPFISGTDQEADFRANGGKQPIYQPRPTGFNRGRVASTDEPRDSPLDRSLGYADLGIGLVRQASCERLDEHEPVDMRGRGMPRQEPVSNRSELSMVAKTFF